MQESKEMLSSEVLTSRIKKLIQEIDSDTQDAITDSDPFIWRRVAKKALKLATLQEQLNRIN